MRQSFLTIFSTWLLFASKFMAYDLEKPTYSNLLWNRPTEVQIKMGGFDLIRPPWATTYYISTTGNDANNGTSTSTPFKTLEKIESLTLGAGDIVYIRSGSYNCGPNGSSATFGSSGSSPYTGGKGTIFTLAGQNGTSGSPILISAYPSDFPGGGRVTFFADKDQSGATVARHTIASGGSMFVGGISVQSGSYVTFRGININGPVQTDNTSYSATANYMMAWFQGGGSNITYDNCEGSFSMEGWRYDAGSNTLFNNCDAHHMDDPYTGGSTGSHNNSDGWQAAYNVLTDTKTWYGCRAWWCSDDGWDNIRSSPLIIFDHCWSFWNGYLPGTFTTGGDGNGFKLGGLTESKNLSGYSRVLKNCLAVGNRWNGMDQNSGEFNIQAWNNTIIGNGGNDVKFGYFPSTTVKDVRNNISYNNCTSGSGCVPIGGTTSDNTNWSFNDHNSWNIRTVTSSDFISLDQNLLDDPRQSDNSLPNNNYGKLPAGNSFINAGVNVGIAYNGSAPDLGFFETGAAAGGTTYYVKPSGSGGSDAAAGTSLATAWATLSKAEATVVAGDFVYIDNGTYAGITTSTSGTSGNIITFQAINTGQVNISSQITCANSYRKFRGLKWTNISDRSFDITGANNEVNNCTVAINYTTGYGIKIGPDAVSGGSSVNNNIVDSCTITSTATTGTVHGVILGGGGTGNVLRNSYFSNSYYGLVDKGELGTLCYNNVFNMTGTNVNSAIYDKGGNGCKYYNNTIRITGNGYGFLIQEDDATSQDPANAFVVNNIFIKGADACIQVGVPGVSAISTMSNNLYQYSSGTVFGVTSPSAVNYTSLSSWQSATGLDANSLTGTPTFVNAGGSMALITDYKPSSGSPVINVGIAVTGRSTDAGKQALVGTPDIGAWEFQSASNIPPNAQAGSDQSIRLPTSSVTQTGSGTDADGTISSYLWTQVSGPNTATISAPSSATSNFTGLIQGTYVFNLRVTDNGGATGNDTFQVIVLPVDPDTKNFIFRVKLLMIAFVKPKEDDTSLSV